MDKQKALERRRANWAKKHPAKISYCVICRVVFANARRHAKTCSKRCSHEHGLRINRRLNAKRPKNGRQWHEIKCDVCGESFHTQQGHAKYCSDDCLKDHERARLLAYRPTKNKLRNWKYHNDPEYRLKHNIRMLKRRAAGTLTATQYKLIMAAHDYKCAYCGSYDDIAMDHKISVKNGGRTNADNIQPLCRSCNSRKHDMNDDEYRAKYPHLIKRPQLEGLLQYVQ